MPYTAEKPSKPLSKEQLRATIPGWGADLDPADRPSVPRERPDVNGARWSFPDRQPELVPRERSVEHAMLTPVFGTVAPLKGLSGVVRRRAYERYSEGRALHWLLLVLGDRIDAVESHLVSIVRLRPDNPFTETGVATELKYGIRSRVGKKRADLKHLWMDPILVAAPWVAVGALIFAVVRLARRR